MSTLAQRLREHIGLTIEIEYEDGAGKQVGAGPLLLIGVTETSAAVYADFVEGWSLQVQDCLSLTIKVQEEVDDRDRELFVECYQKGYYTNLPINQRLANFLSPARVAT